MNYTSMFFALFMSLLTMIIMYIDSRLFDGHLSTVSYVKNMFLVGFVTYAAREWLPETLAIIEQSGDIEFMPDIGEEMYYGKATF